MKNPIIFLMIFILIVGCNEEQSNTLIVGHWKLVDWYDDVARDINNDGTASTDLFSQWNGCKKQSILMLSSNHSGKIIYTGENNNPKCPTDFNTNDFFTTEPWKLENNNLIFIGDDYTDVYEIVELNSSTLVLKRSGLMTCCDPEISYYTGGYLKFDRE